jgi:hypothetical protein
VEITAFPANFGQTHPLNLRAFKIIRDTSQWDNPDRCRGIPQNAEAENLNSPGGYRLLVRWFLLVALSSLFTSPGA